MAQKVFQHTQCQRRRRRRRQQDAFHTSSYVSRHSLSQTMPAARHNSRPRQNTLTHTHRSLYIHRSLTDWVSLPLPLFISHSLHHSFFFSFIFPFIAPSFHHAVILSLSVFYSVLPLSYWDSFFSPALTAVLLLVSPHPSIQSYPILLLSLSPSFSLCLFLSLSPSFPVSPSLPVPFPMFLVSSLSSAFPLHHPP